MILVSVVIPTRGRPELLCRAVRSAMAQTLAAIEVVVVVDGFDPATVLTLQALQQEDERLHVVLLKTSIGGSDARNRGVAEARGEWIAFLDDDDEWFPTKLALQVDAMARFPAPVQIGTCRMIARTPGRDYVWPRRMPAGNEQIGEYLLARTTLTRGEGYIQTSTFFVKRALMIEQPFKSGQLKHQDTEWVLRLALLPGVRVVFADEVLAIHYIEEERSTVSSKSDWRYSLEWLRHDRHLFTPRAFAAFVLYQIAAEASDQGAWIAFPLLLWEALVHGQCAPRGYAIFLAIWLLPRRRRRLLRNWMAHQPMLRLMVDSL